MRFRQLPTDVDARACVTNVAPMRRRWIACVVGAVALAACSSGDDDASSTTAAPPTVASAAPTTAASEPDPTDPPATTAAPATTEAPVETTAAPVATTEPSTTGAATTSTQPRATDEQFAEFRESVETDWREGDRLFDIALTDPRNQDALDAAYAYMTDAVLTGRQAFVERLVERNRRLEWSDERPSVLTIVSGPDPVEGLTVEAAMEYCYLDTARVLELQDDGSEVLVNDDVVTERWSALLRWNGANWQLATLELLQQDDGDAPCG